MGSAPLPLRRPQPNAPNSGPRQIELSAEGTAAFRLLNHGQRTPGLQARTLRAIRHFPVLRGATRHGPLRLFCAIYPATKMLTSEWAVTRNPRLAPRPVAPTHSSSRFRLCSWVQQLTTPRQLPASVQVTILATPKGDCPSRIHRWLVLPFQTK